MNCRVRSNLVVSFILLLGCTSSLPVETPNVTILRGTTVFDGTGKRIENATLTIKNGRIEDIKTGNIDIPGGAEIIDLSGKFITPGLVDAHVHYFQTGFFDSRPDVVDLRDSISFLEVQAYQKQHPERYHEAYLRSGITAVYDVGGILWSIGLQHSAEDDLRAPHVAAAGPLITPVPPERLAHFNTPGENVMIHLASEEVGRQAVEQNDAHGSTGIKIWGVATDDPEFMQDLRGVAEEVEQRGNKLIVHATRLEAAKAALVVGAKLLVHSVTDEVVDEEFIHLLTERNAIYTPTLVVSGGYLKTMKAILGEDFEMKDPNRVIDDKTRNLLESANDFQRYIVVDDFRQRIESLAVFIQQEDSVMAMNLKKLYEAGALIAVGTDAGNPGTLPGISIYDEMEKMQAAGIPAKDLIIMATRNGAMAMERSEDFGTLEKGKMADLVILEADPSEDISNMRTITHVMRGGKLLPVAEKFQ